MDFFDGFEKNGKFYVRYDLNYDLDLDLYHEVDFDF